LINLLFYERETKVESPDDDEKRKKGATTPTPLKGGVSKGKYDNRDDKSSVC